jgi:hypothetical protein
MNLRVMLPYLGICFDVKQGLKEGLSKVVCLTRKRSICNLGKSSVQTIQSIFKYHEDFSYMFKTSSLAMTGNGLKHPVTSPQKQKPQRERRGFKIQWWPEAELNHRHKDFQLPC